MAAYAAVVSLMNTLNNIQDHPIHSFCLDKNQIQSLQKVINFLLDFIESYNSDRGSKGKEVLESKIASAAHTAEDVIESHIVDQILDLAGHGETSSSYFLDLERVIRDMKFVQKKVMQFKEMAKFEDRQPPLYSMAVASSKSFAAAKNVMVGFDDELIRIMDRLTGQQSNLQIIPIVGMGGIGKTTLARNVYENLLIVEHFDIRAWVTISQEYTIKNLFLELISCIKDREINKSLGAFDFETDQESDEDQLGLKLYQALSCRRYLIVLDDIWSIEVWDKIRFFFPDNDYRSRVVITTRILNVASQLSLSSFELNFLDEDESWTLFCEKTFLEEGCPPELEEIGKTIVRECKGLPLSIVVMGGLLRNSMKLEYWESVARDTSSILKLGNDEHCLKILSLSYNHLPAHLKSCFLYMGVFREDHYIRASEFIKLIVAEGFLKTNKPQSLEEVAEDYLKDLVDRNLVLVSSRRWNGRIKYCKMHDLVREVCLRIAEKEKFVYVMRMLDAPPGIDRLERCIVHYERIPQSLPEDFGALPSASLARTFKFEGGPLPFKFRLLRVLTCVEFEPLEAIFQHVNLRYLSYISLWTMMIWKLPSELPSSLFLLWNVQTLNLKRTRGRIFAPFEIWYMRQLRHLIFYSIVLSDPPQDDVVLPNLQTLSEVVNFSFTKEVCKRIPNIKKLRIRYDDFYEEYQKKCYYCFDHLHKLQSLKCSFHQVPEKGELLQSLGFPTSLRKLSLKNSHLYWEDLNTFVLSLPHLEVLKLCEGAVVGPAWECVEGAFPRLKFLEICCEDLINWTAESSDFFPVMEKLHLRNMNKLEKIPSGMGEMQTLRYLCLNYCSESAAISATEILEEQLSLGNEDLKVAVYFTNTEDEESFKKKVEVERFTGKNFEESILGVAGCIIS